LFVGRDKACNLLGSACVTASMSDANALGPMPPADGPSPRARLLVVLALMAVMVAIIAAAVFLVTGSSAGAGGGCGGG